MLDVIRALVEAKADANASKSNGVTSLTMAVESDNFNVVRELSKVKADANAIHD